MKKVPGIDVGVASRLAFFSAGLGIEDCMNLEVGLGGHGECDSVVGCCGMVSGSGSSWQKNGLLTEVPNSSL